ncbi:TPA: cadmium resistance transporter [Streptococcus agalactiae]
MIQNVVTSIILYSGTAVDLLIILMLFFAKRKSRKDIINIYLGQFLGSVSLILLSLLFAFVLDYIPSKEILGLLGLIPIFLGLKVLLLGDSDGETLEKYSRWFIAVVYLGLGMYILIENNSFDMLWAVLG